MSEQAIDIVKMRIHDEAKFMIKNSGNEKNLTDNVILLFEKIYKLEHEKVELIESISIALSKSTNDGWLYRIFENVIKKHNIKTGE